VCACVHDFIRKYVVITKPFFLDFLLIYLHTYVACVICFQTFQKPSKLGFKSNFCFALHCSIISCVHKVFPFQSQELSKNPSPPTMCVLVNTSLGKAPTMALFELEKWERGREETRAIHGMILPKIFPSPHFSSGHSPGEYSLSTAPVTPPSSPTGTR
jgi:hypothetical protein